MQVNSWQRRKAKLDTFRKHLLPLGGSQIRVSCVVSPIKSMEIAGAAIQLARRTPGPSAHRRLLRWLRMSQRVSQGHERNRCTHHEKSHFHIPTLPCSRPARRFHNTIAPAPANKLIPPGNTRCMSWARNARPALEWRVRRSPDTGHGSGALDVRFLPIVVKSARWPLGRGNAAVQR